MAVRMQTARLAPRPPTPTSPHPLLPTPSLPRPPRPPACSPTHPWATCPQTRQSQVNAAYSTATWRPQPPSEIWVSTGLWAKVGRVPRPGAGVTARGQGSSSQEPPLHTKHRSAFPLPCALSGRLVPGGPHSLAAADLNLPSGASRPAAARPPRTVRRAPWSRCSWTRRLRRPSRLRGAASAFKSGCTLVTSPREQGRLCRGRARGRSHRMWEGFFIQAMAGPPGHTRDSHVWQRHAAPSARPPVHWHSAQTTARSPRVWRLPAARTVLGP